MCEVEKKFFLDPGELFSDTRIEDESEGLRFQRVHLSWWFLRRLPMEKRGKSAKEELSTKREMLKKGGKHKKSL